MFAYRNEMQIYDKSKKFFVAKEILIMDGTKTESPLSL